MQQTNWAVGRSLQRTGPPASISASPEHRTTRPHAIQDQPVSTLVADLLEKLDLEDVSYCHWKSNWRMDEWLSGKGDLDLLVAREDVTKFHSILAALGFKKALVDPSKELPGIANFYGYDRDLQRFIHIHAHYQLVLGHDASKNYRLPIESVLLSSAQRRGPIKIVSPDLERALFVVRMTLKSSLFESGVRSLIGRSVHGEIRRELSFLRSCSDDGEYEIRLNQLFPDIESTLIHRCETALLSGIPLRMARLRRRLERALSPHSRMSRSREWRKRLKTYASAGARKIKLTAAGLKTLESGGSLVAFVGGDGSGKSTCANEVAKWLGKKFRTVQVHMGMPPRSWTTLSVIAAIRVRRFGTRMRDIILLRRTKKFNPFNPRIDFLERLRWLATARDRWLLYKKVRRYATNGGIALCDRYPMKGIELMDAPRIERSLTGKPSRLEQRLINAEHRYYDRIRPPDKLIVLLVNPDLAVQRKTNEPAEHVARRSLEVWQNNWEQIRADVIDASKSRSAVLDEVRSRIWNAL